jgi:hypothetical protein
VQLLCNRLHYNFSMERKINSKAKILVHFSGSISATFEKVFLFVVMRLGPHNMSTLWLCKDVKLINKGE